MNVWMSRLLRATIAAAAILVVTMGAGSAFAGGNRAKSNSATVAPRQPPEPPKKIEGHILSVWRESREITVQTPEGEIRQVKVPENAVITSREGGHFSSVRSGETVHVTAVNDANRGLVARTISIP